MQGPRLWAGDIFLLFDHSGVVLFDVCQYENTAKGLDAKVDSCRTMTEIFDRPDRARHTQRELVIGMTTKLGLYLKLWTRYSIRLKPYLIASISGYVFHLLRLVGLSLIATFACSSYMCTSSTVLLVA